MLTQQRLKEVLSYDADTGVFVWKMHRRNPSLVGQVAGCRFPQGYWHISVDDVKYRAHRLAWLYVYGAWPSGSLDHKNLNKSDNAIANLREATRSQNEQNKPVRRNSTSGVTGVYWNKCAAKWQAYIKKDGKVQYLGIYQELSDAVRVRRNAEANIFGEFALGAT